MTDKYNMVEYHLKERGITNKKVLDAFNKVPREEFVLEKDRKKAYADTPLPIGHCQTISQPYIVALTVQALKIAETDTVLELGTGFGYEAAIIAELCEKVITIERIPELAEKAERILDDLGYTNIEVVVADGTVGYPEYAPYNAVAVSAAAPDVPPSLLAQLAPEGRMIIPVGRHGCHELIFIEKNEQGEVRERKNICDCRFVPLIGEQGFKEGEQ